MTASYWLRINIEVILVMFFCLALSSIVSCLSKHAFRTRSHQSQLTIACLLLVTWCSAFTGIAVAQTKSATGSTLVITSNGKTVSSVTAGSVVRLTAHVSAGATAVTPGQVNFCDASATSCTDIHLLGTAQLTAAGTAADWPSRAARRSLLPSG